MAGRSASRRDFKAGSARGIKKAAGLRDRELKVGIPKGRPVAKGSTRPSGFRSALKSIRVAVDGRGENL